MLTFKKDLEKTLDFPEAEKMVQAADSYWTDRQEFSELKIPYNPSGGSGLANLESIGKNQLPFAQGGTVTA